MPASERLQADASLNLVMKDLPQVEAANSVVAFYTHESEANVIPFLEWVLETGRELFLPRINHDWLDLVKVESLRDLEKGSFGIYEPKLQLEASDRTDFDLVLVPGLVFAKDGHRVGYGMGCYDKLLKKITGHSLGVCYDFQVVDEVPTDDQDVKVDAIITDKSTYII